MFESRMQTAQACLFLAGILEGAAILTFIFGSVAVGIFLLVVSQPWRLWATISPPMRKATHRSSAFRSAWRSELRARSSMPFYRRNRREHL